ncbi:TniQ family protein [Pseudoalteromonas sp. BDTF-M6]|uniref:TniQ family protein n=1 Tax=Pseudoalteromonas sp. BDTF-M6 TaxID=2796132 RepID=UPI001BB074B1|nr:TniQ family protein [Pseudoalteromonas sp. BDTF-M6]MBS3797181.1 TniQ family protein [Pseudoalteromonas sp. BDTF-M6]
MPNQLVIRPRPNQGENLLGFLLRLANENGYYRHGAIFKVLGLKPQKGAFNVSSARFNEFMAALAHALCMGTNTLKTLFLPTHIDDDLPLSTVKSSLCPTLHICSTCLSGKDGFIRHDWQKCHVTHCERHKVALIDACPSCLQSLQWNADIFDGCSHCGLRWHDYCALPHPSIPSYQSYVETLQGDKKQTYLEALYSAALMINKPYRFSNDSIGSWKFNNNESQDLFNKGYWLLASKEHQVQFFNALQRSLRDSTTAISASTLKSLSHPIKQLPNLQLPAAAFTVNIDTLLPCKVFCSLSDVQASKLLGITPAELNQLARQDVISAAINNKMYTYNLEHVDDFLGTLLNKARLSTGAKSQDWLPLSELAMESQQFFFNFGEAIELILKENIPLFQRATTRSLKELYVSKSAIYSLLAEHEHSQFNRLFSQSELRAYFCVQQVKIDALATLFAWEKVCVNRTWGQYTHKSIREFIDSYLLLDKWCKSRPYPKATLFNYLKSQGVLPVEGHDAYQTKLHVFEKSEKLMGSIALFEQCWRKSKQPYLEVEPH